MHSLVFRPLSRMLPLMAAALLLTACSTKNTDDPLESYNRGMFAVNKQIDSFLLRPVAKGYRYVTPEGIRSRIGNASDNLHEPLNMMNAFLQGDFDHGMVSFWRFMINSTVGLAGLHDVAATAGLSPRREDFGQTLAVWGVGSGPYLVLPVFGPSNLRDTGGRVGDWAADPVNWAVDDSSDEIWLAIGQGVVERERLLDPIDDVYASSIDPYESFKSIYEQRRAAQIKNLHDAQ
jgi:phospholipid-binding lipoprotein MlaA